MRKIITIVICLFFFIGIQAQEMLYYERDTTVYDATLLVKKALPPGGFGVWYKKVAHEAVAFYPTSSYSESTVYMYFIIEKDGSMTNLKILRHFDIQLADAALKAIRKVYQEDGQWQPAEYEGKIVRVCYVIPFEFRLSPIEHLTSKQ